MPLKAGFRIGERDVFPLEHRIVGPDGESRVEPKAMAVLVELALQAPEVCSREHIVTKVWPRGFVTDDVLTRCVGQIRKALGDDPRAPRLLETIPKRGYRLCLAVEKRPGDETREPVSAPRRESLIVLPFQNLAGREEEFVADSLTELLILRLAALRNIRVISRTTSMQFKGNRTGVGEIAARTGVDWVIEGSVLQSSNRIQVVAQLIDARTDAHVWASDYVRDLQDVLPLLNEIARRVADAIRLQLGATEERPPPLPPLTPDVMREYLRGRYLLTKRTLPALRSALGCFAATATAAPDFAPGWASQAEAEMLLAHYGDPQREQWIERCEEHIDRALTLDPNLAIAIATRGGARFFFRCDLAGASADLERALQLLPSYSLAMVSLANVSAVRHRFEEASAWLDQALLVDPLDVGINMNVGDHMILQRRYPEAVLALRKALELSPAHRPSQLRLCWALALASQASEAHELLARIGSEGTEDTQWQEYAALVAGAAGDAPAAMGHFRALEALRAAGKPTAWSLARAAAAAGLEDAAVDFLGAAVAERSSSLPFLNVTPAFSALHSNRRFRELAAALGLTTPD